MSGSSDPHERRNDLGTVSTERLGEIIVPVKMQVTRDRTERPRGALLQPDIECWYSLYRIGRSLGNRSASFGGGIGGILPWLY